MSKRRVTKRQVERQVGRYRDEFYNLGRSFLFAFRGFKFAIDNERNMRIHLSVALFMIQFAMIYGLPTTEYVLLIIVFALVIAAEMVNTAIEALVDLQTQSYENLARIAKDVAAGAVLVLAIASVAVAGFLFHDIQKLQATLFYVLDKPWLLVIFLLEAIVALSFIFFWQNRRITKRKRFKK